MPRTVYARETRFGGYLEDYEVGDVFHHWPGKTVTEAEVHQFCLLTMAAHPVHIDRTYVASMSYDQNIVIGTYIFSLLLGMSVPDISGRALANLGADELRHVAPLFYGDTLFGTSEVVDVRLSASHPGAGILSVRTTGTNQDGTVVCVYRRAVLLPCRGESDTAATA